MIPIFSGVTVTIAQCEQSISDRVGAFAAEKVNFGPVKWRKQCFGQKDYRLTRNCFEEIVSKLETVCSDVSYWTLYSLLWTDRKAHYLPSFKYCQPGVACGDATRDVMPSGKTSRVTHDVLPQMAKHHGVPMMFCH